MISYSSPTTLRQIPAFLLKNTKSWCPQPSCHVKTAREMTRTSHWEKIFFICPNRLTPEQDRFKQFPTPGPKGWTCPGNSRGGAVTGQIEPYITTPFLSEKELNRPILFKSYRVTLSFKDSDHLRQTFKLPQSSVVESYVTAFRDKVINSILCTNTKLCKIGFRTNDLLDLRTFSDYHCISLFSICSVTAHSLNSFGLNLNYIDALFRINEFV